MSLGGVALLTAYEWGLLPRASIYNVALIAGLFAAVATVPRLFADPDTRRESRHVLLLIASMLTFFFLVRSPVNIHLSLAPAAAALGLSARLVRPMRPDVRRAAHVLLLCLGLIIAGWVSVCWSTTHVEWAFLSEHFGAEQIRSHVLLFLPLLALRYALPVFVFRQVVQAELGDTDRRQHDWVWTAYGAKLGAVVAGTLRRRPGDRHDRVLPRRRPAGCRLGDPRLRVARIAPRGSRSDARCRDVLALGHGGSGRARSRARRTVSDRPDRGC